MEFHADKVFGCVFPNDGQPLECKENIICGKF